MKVAYIHSALLLLCLVISVNTAYADHFHFETWQYKKSSFRITIQPTRFLVEKKHGGTSRFHHDARWCTAETSRATFDELMTNLASTIAPEDQEVVTYTLDGPSWALELETTKVFIDRRGSVDPGYLNKVNSLVSAFLKTTGCSEFEAPHYSNLE